MSFSILTRYFLSRQWHHWNQLIRAFKDSLFFSPKELAETQFLRYVLYRKTQNWLSCHLSIDSSFKVIEFGDSNGIIKNFLQKTDYEIAPNFPCVDIQNLTNYLDESYDAVVIDNVLEHVSDPGVAIAEIWRILKRGGFCICTTPFLIQVHPYPSDYYRYTEDGLRQIFKKFREIEISGWGNRFTLETILYHGWLSAKNTKAIFRAALWNEPEWPLLFLTISTK